MPVTKASNLGLIMFKFHLILFNLHLVSVLCCSLNPVRQYGHDIWWTNSCITDTDNANELAVCLLQRNTLDRVLECADSATDWGADHYIYWRVPEGSYQDLLDLIPSESHSAADKFDWHDDGRLKVTPRGLLLAAAATEECQQCNLAQVFQSCPFTKWQDFIDCLCCQKVRSNHIRCFENCIWDYSKQYGRQFEDERTRWTCVPQAACAWSGASSSSNQLNAEDVGLASQASLDDDCRSGISVLGGKTSTICATSKSFTRTLTIPGDPPSTSRPNVTYSSRTQAPDTARVATQLSTAPSNEAVAQTEIPTAGVGRLKFKITRIFVLFSLEFITIIAGCIL